MMQPIRNDISRMIGTARTPASSICRATAMPRKVAGRTNDIDRIRCTVAAEHAQQRVRRRAATESTVSPISSRMLRRLRRISFSSPATTVRTRSISRARPASAPRQSTRPPPSDDAPLGRWRAERRRRCRARQSSVRSMTSCSARWAALRREGRCSLCSSVAGPVDHPFPAGKQEQPARLEMMVERCLHGLAASLPAFPG